MGSFCWVLVFLLFGSANSYRKTRQIWKCPECESFFDEFCPNYANNELEKLVCEALEGVCNFFVCPAEDVVDHLPFSDNDGDHFSTKFGLRGSAWRGKDCDDDNSSVYPGRNTVPDGVKPSDDYNCNGIYGMYNSTHTYKEVFCGNSQQQGVILLSDSTGTHFGPPIYPFAGPEEWYENFELELDWPHCSWGTGHSSNSECQQSPLTANSFYLQLWNRNRCNHRDFQDIAVDGARSGPMSDSIVNTTARNQVTDHPALVLFALVANDVCNPHPTTDHMTTPEEFAANNERTLEWLDKHLAPNSHVLFIGLFHGEMIYDIMHNQSYPYFGITYGELWEMLSTHFTGGADNRTLNPCWGWLNKDAKWRQLTTQRALQLDEALKQIVATKKYKNFDLYYMDHPDYNVTMKWLKEGNDGAALFQAVGGAHPSQTASVLWSEAVWNYVEANFPQILGPINPYNANIAKIFGDQGGY